MAKTIQNTKLTTSNAALSIDKPIALGSAQWSVLSCRNG